MSPVSSPNATALMVLQQTAALDKGRNDRKPDLVSIANGVSAPGEARVQSGPKVVHPVNDMFSVMSVDINKMKINLMERVGKELGVSFDDYEKASDFGRALQEAVNEIKMSPNGDVVLRRIERQVGLDKLGISLDEFVQAIIDPEGRAAEKLDAALLREAGGEALELVEDDDQVQGWPRIDEIGIYSY